MVMAACASGTRMRRHKKRPLSRMRSQKPPATSRPKSRPPRHETKQARNETEKKRKTTKRANLPLETVVATDLKSDVGVGDYQYGFHDPTDQYVFKSRKGLDEAIVRQISAMKNEPAWMLDFRLEALKIFFQK